MKCPDMGTLQAYIDNEVDIALKKEIETHLINCVKCRETYAELKSNDDFAFGKMGAYRDYAEERFIHTANSSKFSVKVEKSVAPKRGIYQFIKKYRSLVAAACVLLVFTTCITVQPVRAFISDALSIFRVENVKGFNITVQDINEIQQKLASKEPDINIEKFGRINTTGGEMSSVSLDKLKDSVDFPVLIPSVMKDSSPEVYKFSRQKIEYTLNIPSINKLMKSLDAQKLLPDNADGKTFSVVFADHVLLHYNEENGPIKVEESKLPEIYVPEDVNVDDIYNSLVDMPILPKDLQDRLKSIKDWKNTLYIPIIPSVTEEININGCKGYIMSSDNVNDRSTVRTSLMWFKNGVAYAVYGNADKAEIMKIAESMR